jgi:uncharacterized protein (DUF1499 family)
LRSIAFKVSADSLLAAARRALESMSPSEVDEIAPNRIASAHAVFSFTDDMEFQVDPVDGGSVIHIRSASREGTWDLGVNGRRVRRFLKRVRKQLGQ